ncbi:MAG TPA: DUF58 domain-containing protein [Pirellulaceae bacterium]|nr:DUF58 domain-containing protein [Pirellulaceae bacterium]
MKTIPGRLGVTFPTALWRRIGPSNGWTERLDRLRPVIKRCFRTAGDRIPVTATGFCLALFLIFINQFVGAAVDDRIIRVGCATGLFVMGSCAVAVFVAAFIIRFRRVDGPSRRILMVVGTSQRLGAEGVLPRWFPLVQLDVTWENMPNVRVETASDRDGDVEIVTAQKRGVCNRLVRRYCITDTFGLTRWSVRRSSNDEIFIRPASCSDIAIKTQGIVPADVAADPSGQPHGDLLESRRYETGDPLRLVLWKVYARSGQMLIRSPERTSAPQSRLMAYFVTGDHDDATAAVACRLLESAGLGSSLLFQCDGANSTVQTPCEAIDQIVRSGNSAAVDESQLTRFLQVGTAQGLTTCILFVPPSPGRWIDVVAAAAEKFPGKIQVVMGADATPEPIESSKPSKSVKMPWNLFIQTNIAISANSSADWKTAAHALARRGQNVSVFDRRSGLELAP